MSSVNELLCPHTHCFSLLLRFHWAADVPVLVQPWIFTLELLNKTSPLFVPGMETSVLQGVWDPGGTASSPGVWVFEQAQAYVVCNWKLSQSRILEVGCRANKSIEKQLPANRLYAEGVQLVLLPPLTTELFTYRRYTRRKCSFSQIKLLLVKFSFIYFPPG